MTHLSRVRIPGRGIRRALTVAGATGVVACALACFTPSPPDPGGPDLYRVAISGAPGGSLLGVWGEGAMVPGHAFLAGGFVGVDPATLAGAPAGRLVEYTGPGTFVTRCTADHVLWWVHGVRDASNALTVYASGEGGRVVRYRPGDPQGPCTVLDLGVTFPGGAPTLWGIDALAPNDVWFVGGSADPGGPHGVVLRYDGTAFHPDTTLPQGAAAENFYKVATSADGLVIVGSGGMLLHADATGAISRIPLDTLPSDNRLFTVSCATTTCWAVGGTGSGIILSGDASGWSPTHLVEPPGLNGVWMQDANNVFIVGVGGFTMHTNGTRVYTPPSPPTQATLHGVGGFNGTVIAVGGELSVSTPAQRGVILVRGDSSAQFTLDGTAYTATGTLRTALGGTGQ